MTIAQMRLYLAEHPKYKNSDRWRRRVANMPEPQVYAIFKQFQKADNKAKEEQDKYHQIDMFEYMEGLK